MNKNLDAIFKRNQLNSDAIDLFLKVENILLSEIDGLESTIWAGHPIYLLNDKSIIIAPFKDHVNIVSNPHRTEKTKQYKNAVLSNVELVQKHYKITPKGMMQVFLSDPLDEEIIRKVFRDTYSQTIE